MISIRLICSLNVNLICSINVNLTYYINVNLTFLINVGLACCINGYLTYCINGYLTYCINGSLAITSNANPNTKLILISLIPTNTISIIITTLNLSQTISLKIHTTIGKFWNASLKLIIIIIINNAECNKSFAELLSTYRCKKSIEYNTANGCWNEHWTSQFTK